MTITNCTICKRTSESVAIFRSRFFNVYDQVVNTTYMCKDCIEAFKWGNAQDNESYVEHDSLDDESYVEHELDEQHAYRNALAAALAGVSGNSNLKCTAAANVVLDRKILPPTGKPRDTYADCGRMAVMYIKFDITWHRTTEDKHLGMDRYIEILMNGDIEKLRRTASVVI